MLFPYRYVAILQPYAQTECLWAFLDARRPFIWILNPAADNEAVPEKVQEKVPASL